MDAFVRDDVFLIFLLAELTLVYFYVEARKEYILDGPGLYVYVCGAICLIALAALTTTVVMYLMSAIYVPNFIVFGLGTWGLTLWAHDFKDRQFGQC